MTTIWPVVAGGASVAFYIYGYGRVVRNPLRIQLRDTKQYEYRYDLKSGTFWDSVDVQQFRRSDHSLMSEEHHSTFRRIAIDHQELDE